MRGEGMNLEKIFYDKREILEIMSFINFYTTEIWFC